MDRNEAASVIQRFLTCRDICRNECYGYCETCRYNTEYAEETEALKLAIEALGKDTNVPAKWIPFKTRPLTEEEKEEYPEWDSILDCKLPDDGQEILVNIKYKGHEAVQMDEFCTDDGCYLDSGYEIGTEATAWMPLPEPWKGENDGQTG